MSFFSIDNSALIPLFESINLLSSGEYNEGDIIKKIFCKFIFWMKLFILLFCNPDIQLIGTLSRFLSQFELLKNNIVPTSPSYPIKKFK